MNKISIVIFYPMAIILLASVPNLLGLEILIMVTFVPGSTNYVSFVHSPSFTFLFQIYSEMRNIKGGLH